MGDNELGTFIRQRREAVSPAQVGLPPGGRRRTPGLRRAELATLSGVSVDYLTRLEQGRDHNPSAQVLAALSDTLQLSDEERMLLMKLGTIASSGEMCPSVRPPDHELRPSVRLLLGRMEPTPAAIVDRTGEVLAHTDGWARLFGDLGVLDDGNPNLLRHLFTDPRARAAHPAWDVVADAVSAELKADNRRDDPHFQAFVESLGSPGSEDLTTRLAKAPSVARRSYVVRLVHPVVGELRLARESLQIADSDQRLVTHLPDDDATATALDELLLGRTGGLRAV